ncbi:unnamed protein product, partial [Polarella glacialis]
VYHAAAYDQPSEISKSLSQSSASSVCSTTTSSVEVVTEKQNVASTAPAAARRKKTVSAPVARAAAPAKHQPPSAPSVRKAERRRPQRATGDATPQGSLWQSAAQLFTTSRDAMWYTSQATMSALRTLAKATPGGAPTLVVAAMMALLAAVLARIPSDDSGYHGRPTAWHGHSSYSGAGSRSSYGYPSSGAYYSAYGNPSYGNPSYEEASRRYDERLRAMEGTGSGSGRTASSGRRDSKKANIASQAERKRAMQDLFLADLAGAAEEQCSRDPKSCSEAAEIQRAAGRNGNPSGSSIESLEALSGRMPSNEQWEEMLRRYDLPSPLKGGVQSQDVLDSYAYMMRLQSMADMYYGSHHASR